MNKRDESFQRKLLETFRTEADEHLQAISSGLLQLEKSQSSSQPELVETIFREVHSLKGAARAVSLSEVETVCQALESVFSVFKRQSVVVSPELVDLLHQATDGLGQLLVTDAAHRRAEVPRLTTLIRQVESLLKQGSAPAASTPTPAEPPAPQPLPTPTADSPTHEERPAVADTIRTSTARLDSILLQTEEFLSAKLSAGQRAADLRALQAELITWRREWAKIQPSVRIAPRTLAKGGNSEKAEQQLGRLLEFVEWNKTLLETLEQQLAVTTQATEHDSRVLGTMVDNLLKDVKQTLMLPFASLLEGTPKLVRDLAHQQAKQVELVIHGSEIEVDRRILQELKDPLVHLIRNCVDHGIEKPAERERRHKPTSGTITIAVTPRESSKVEVLIADDGAGIDTDRVRAVALRQGLVSADNLAGLSEPEILKLVFQSGLSTSPIITDLSGHGLGLAIVQEKVERLGGSVSLESQPGAGATFRLLLPLTLATFRGLLVRVAEQRFVLPTAQVERVARVNVNDIQTVENRETVRLVGSLISLVRLGDVLGLPRPSLDATPDRVPVVVLAVADKRIAFVVSEILGEQEVLVKSLGPQLVRVQNIAGATVLGTGQVVPILNVPDLMKAAVKTASAPTAATAPAQAAAVQRKSILVVEDSITARSLLRNILESANYAVKTAVDGIEAYTYLNSESFDLVISDVEMPRMNGFDLTAKIRADKKWADLPVVLVTALDSRQDQERGIDVGANAYIVKSNFDQTSLLEVVRRLA